LKAQILESIFACFLWGKRVKKQQKGRGNYDIKTSEENANERKYRFMGYLMTLFQLTRSWS
jgi:stalled ribosome alternative rescue factor ArfA